MKRVGLLWCILTSMIVCVGCHRGFTKKEAFKNIKDRMDIEEIDINFARRDRALQDTECYQFGLRIDSYEGDTWHPTVEYSPENGKLRIHIKADGSEWEIGHLYSSDQTPRICSDILWEEVSEERAAEMRERYQNARWELVFLQIDFEFWIEDFIISTDDKNPSKEKELELCYIVDMETKTRFKVSLEYIKEKDA